MIKDKRILREFNYNYFRKRRYSLGDKFKIQEALFQLARQWKVLPLRQPLEGIKVCLKIAKILNQK